MKIRITLFNFNPNFMCIIDDGQKKFKNIIAQMYAKISTRKAKKMKRK
jgi:hypothetical protein